MPVELQVLAYAGLLQFLQIVLFAVPANVQLGPKYTAGPRDEERKPTGVTARLSRAVDNHYEGLTLFTIAVLVVVLGDAGSALTANCAWAYLIARIFYVPAYASGVFLVRSLIWAVGFFATLIMLVSAVL